MSASIVPHLVRKDLGINGRTIATFCLISVVCLITLALLYGRIPNWVLLNFGFTFVVGPVGTCGIVLLMKTNVFEKEKSTQPFIMSLPLTVREFTRAKLWANIPVFAAMWTAVSAVTMAFVITHDLFPRGAVPFITMIFTGVFVAYTCILATSLLSQSLGITILGILFFELGTSAYMWALAVYPPIASHYGGTDIVWTPEAVMVLVVQAFVAIAAILTALLVQNARRDFI